MKIYTLLTAVLLILAGQAPADTTPSDKLDVRPSQAWEKAYQNRVKLLIGSRSFRYDNPNRDGDVGKWTWSPLLADMWKAERKGGVEQLIATKGNDFIKSRYAGSYFKPFSAPGHTMYYFTFKDKLPADQISHAKNMIQKQGWEQMMRPDGRMDPIYSLTEFNSENFNWMARMAGVLWAEELGDAEKKAYFDGYLMNLTRALYNAGRVEWNSNNYWGHTFNPIMSLASNVKDPEHRERAWAIADWMVLEAALHYLDGFQVAVDTRAKTNAYKPFAGSVWAYTYLYFVGDGFHPTFKPNAIHSHQHYKSEAGYFGYSTYRPPQVAIDIAQKKFKTPVEIQSAKPFYRLDNNNYKAWDGTGDGRRNEFETLYLGENFILASLATLRPSGLAEHPNEGPGGPVQRPFSEQSVWRLGVKGNGNGAVQVYGNAGAPGGWGKGWDTMAGRQPWEQIGQYGPTMIRLWKALERGWIAVPNGAKTKNGPGNRLFVDMGHGVYFGICPVNATGYAAEDIKGRKGKPGTHKRHVWTFNKAKLGGLVLEVGTKSTHGSFANFSKSFQQSKPTVTGDAVQWASLNGDKLKVEHTGVTTYTMIDGTVIKPAGKLPKVWMDGKETDFMSWNSYEVIRGEKIIDQPWGGGQLTATVNGKGMQVTIDPETAEAAWRKVE